MSKTEIPKIMIQAYQFFAGLEPDGIYGPKTKEAVAKSQGQRSIDLCVSLLRGLPKTHERQKETTLFADTRIWEQLTRDIGLGGDQGTNNVSPWIQSLRYNCGFPVDATGPWCGVYASERLQLFGIPVKSRGAYRLCEKLANSPYGEEIKPLDMKKREVYLACWKRGRWASHGEAHVRFVMKASDTRFAMIGGNEKEDKVRRTQCGFDGFQKDLIMVVKVIPGGGQ